MLHLVGKIPVEGVHHTPVPGELFKGERGDKLCGMGGHNHLYIGVLLHQRGGQRRRFIGRNASCNPQQDGFFR